jgi:trans-AT polyketide synthase, acyltransferase and oxidoreductase domains
MTVICMFPGQGSQAVGMGTGLFERFPDWTAQADEVLGYSVRELCLDDPRGVLGLTQFTQPALFVVNALSYRARQESGRPAPSFLVGHSLGESNALHAAGVFDFATGVRLAKERGEFMGVSGGGGMLAVVGLGPGRVTQVLGATDAGRRVDVANLNSFEQVVVAGPKEDLAELAPQLEAAGARAAIPLNVSAPFHSRYMRAAQTDFAVFLGDFTFEPPQIPVIANATAAPYEANRIRATLASQISSPVRWLDSVVRLLGEPEPQFEEIGPGTVLTKLVAQIRKHRDRAGTPEA